MNINKTAEKYVIHDLVLDESDVLNTLRFSAHSHKPNMHTLLK